MCKALRVTLPVLLAGMLCMGLGANLALADCSAGGGIPVSQGLGTLHNNFVGGSSFDAATCGSNPDRHFWAIGLGNPAIGLGVDSGNTVGIFWDPFGPPPAFILNSDWGDFGVEGCIGDSANFQADGSFRPQVTLVSNGVGEGTAAHTGTYSVLSVDLDSFFNSYNLDYADDTVIDEPPAGPGPEDHEAVIVCANVPAPSISSPSGTGPFTATLTWGGVSGLDDCSANPDINLASDCTAPGPHRTIQNGWKVYSKEAPCTLGTLSGDRTTWTQEGGLLATGANAGTVVTISAASGGNCRFVAISPVWDSGYEGQFLSAQAGPLGGSGDADGDGIPDLTDTCPHLASANNADTDHDGVGDACDNCPLNANPDQSDVNHNGIGDVCDICTGNATDVDGDLVCSNIDNCPTVYNPSQADADHDGIGDACDPCPNDPTNDVDGDGVCGQSDNCPTVANADQKDTDGDGKGDVCDACPFEKANDGDGDGKCACDIALFNAGKCPGTLGVDFDNCPTLSNADQTPSGYGDGYGKVCDDILVSAAVKPINDQGFGDCTITWKTSREFLCPDFNVIYRSAAGDRNTGVTTTCTNCTGGTKNTNYPKAGPGYIAKCHGGHNIRVQAVRTPGTGNHCGKALYNTVVGHNIEVLATRSR